MNTLERLTVQARKDPQILKSNEFIYARRTEPDLFLMLLEMGPNCNSRCSHCCSELGPEKEGLPTPEIVSEALDQAYRSGITRVALTDGEPFREENKKVLQIASKESQYFAINFITNGIFARKAEDALSYMTLLKESGLNFESAHLRASTGFMYPTTMHNQLNMLRAMKQMGIKDIGNFFDILFLKSYDPIQCKAKLEELVNGVYEVLGESKEYTYSEDIDDQWIKCHTLFGDVKIDVAEVDPHGRARKWKFFDKHWPIKQLGIEDLFIERRPVSDIEVFSNGDVHFSDAGGPIGRGTPYGNINETHLFVIAQKIRRDPLFQGFKLGGSALLYHAAMQIQPGYRVIGRTEWDVSRDIFAKPQLIQSIREYFLQEGIEDAYKQMLSKCDLKKGPKV